MKFIERLEKNNDYWFLLISSFILFLLRLPSLFEPYWYGDEGVYQVIGIALRQGRLLYRDIFDNKPPLLYMLYSLFNSDQFMVRLASLIFAILSVIIFFFLLKRILGPEHNKILFIATSIFTILYGIPNLEGNIANAENFMILPILIAVFLFVNYKNITRLSSFFIIGLLLGTAFLFKIVAVFDLGTLLVFWIFLNFSESDSLSNIKRVFLSEFKKILILLSGFLIPIALTVLFFFIKGAFSDFLTAVLFSNIGYVGYTNKLLGIPQGLLILKLIFLFAFIVFLFTIKRKLKITEIFVFLWFSFSLFNVFFSGRPYTHYLLLLLPSFCLMLGLAMKKQKIPIILLIISIPIILNNFSIYSCKYTLLYYKNFTLFMTGKITVFSYRGFFDKNTPYDYELAQLIKIKKAPKDQVFIWGNNAQVYKLIGGGVLPPGKYTVEYHMTEYKDGLTNTEQALERVKPKFIVTMSNVPAIPFSLANYINLININNISVYERFF